MKAINVNSISVRIRRNLLIKFARFFPDRTFLELLFPLRTGYTLDLENPQTYNEKLQWLKLYNRKPDYIQMVDKVEAKKYAASIIGEEHIIPTLAVYDRAEDIDFDMLPQQFVLKCTHDSGGIVICSDKDRLDKAAAIKKLKKGLKKNYYFRNREWPYKNVKPRIIAEKYMTDDGHELKDYKFFCFDGEPKAMFIASDRFDKNEETKFDFFDMDFNHLPFTNGHPNATKHIDKPGGFEEMKALAAKLSKGMPHVRADFYDINGKVYFGEMTFFHWSGMVSFVPKEWDYKFGEFIHINTK
jgi:hypothetical protein